MNVFNQKVTLINVSDVAFKKTILSDCMWKTKCIKTVENNQVRVKRYYSVTIPYQKGNFVLNADNNQDLLILGELSTEVTAENYEEILKRDNVGIISAVYDNTMRDSLKHWRVECM